MNPTVQWTNLQIGQVLIIPCEDDKMPAPPTGTQYTVVAGDTGNAIAAAAGITFELLDAANPGVNWYNLQIGQVLNLPSNTTAPSMTTQTLPFPDPNTTTAATPTTTLPIESTPPPEETTPPENSEPEPSSPETPPPANEGYHRGEGIRTRSRAHLSL